MTGRQLRRAAGHRRALAGRMPAALAGLAGPGAGLGWPCRALPGLTRRGVGRWPPGCGCAPGCELRLRLRPDARSPTATTGGEHGEIVDGDGARRGALIGATSRPRTLEAISAASAGLPRSSSTAELGDLGGDARLAALEDARRLGARLGHDLAPRAWRSRRGAARARRRPSRRTFSSSRLVAAGEARRPSRPSRAPRAWRPRCGARAPRRPSSGSKSSGCMSCDEGGEEQELGEERQVEIDGDARARGEEARRSARKVHDALGPRGRPVAEDPARGNTTDYRER